MKNILCIIFLFVFVNHYAQIEEHTKSKKELRMEKQLQNKKGKEVEITQYVNPSKTWYFGTEIGTNYMRSYHINHRSRISFQGGVTVDYFFKRYFSIAVKVNYFKTGLSFYKNYYPTNDNDNITRFRGDNIVLSLGLKWSFRVYDNLFLGAKIAPTYAIETNEKYINYTNEILAKVKKEKSTFNVVFETDIFYFINKSKSFHLTFGSYLGDYKGSTIQGVFLTPHYNVNFLTSIVYKYSFN